MELRPNFYEFLGLDPKIDDWESLQSTLSKMRNRWTAARTQPNQAVREKAELGLSLIDEMERVFRDPVLRRQEAEVLLRARAEEAEKKASELDNLIRRLSEGGQGCSEEQFRRLVDRFRGVFDEVAVRQRLEAAGLPPGEAPVPGGVPRHHFLEEHLLRDIDQRLKVCHQPDLYALLGVSPEVPPEAALQRADQRYKEIVRVGKTDPRSTAEKELAGIAQDLFQSADKKARYDNSLAARPMAELREDIEHAGALGTLRDTDLDDLVRRAANQGVPRDLARSYVLSYAERKGWEVILSPPPDPHTEMMRAAARAAEDAARAAREMKEEARRERERARAEQERRDQEERQRGSAAAAAAAAAATSSQGSPTPSPPQGPRGGPLPAPSHLETMPVAGGFRLRWEPVAGFAEPVQYVVVRKQGAIPQHEGDGEMVSPDLSMARFDDTSAPTGELVYYAVFSLKGSDVSEQAAISDGLVAKAAGGGGGKWAAAALVLLLIGSGGWWAWHQSQEPPPIEVTPPPITPPPPPPAPDPSSPSAGVQGSHNGTGNASIPQKKKPVVKPPPPTATVTVIGASDSGILDSFTEQLTDDLSHRGIQVRRPGGLLQIKSLLRRGADESEVLQALQGGDVQVLVWAEAHEISQREIRYLRNRTDTLHKTAIEVHAFLVPNRNELGGGWREEVEHTSINTQQMAEKAMLAMGYDLSSAIETGWQRYRQTQP